MRVLLSPFNLKASAKCSPIALVLPSILPAVLVLGYLGLGLGAFALAFALLGAFALVFALIFAFVLLGAFVFGLAINFILVHCVATRWCGQRPQGGGWA